MANLEFCDTHNMVAYLNKSEGSKGFYQIVDFLNHSHISTLDSEVIQITVTIDGKVKIITEASIRRHLKLEDSDGSTVPVKSHHTPTGATSTSQPPLSSPSRIPTRQESEVPQPRSPTQTPAADEAASTGVDVRHGGAATTVSSLDAGQGSGNIDKTPTMPHDSPLPRVHTLGSDEGRMQHNELMDLVTKLSDRVVALETDLRQTKKVYGAAYTKLIKKVKKLERAAKSSQSRRRANIVVSDDEDDVEDSSNQGRKIDEIDQDPDITLVQHDAKIQGRHGLEIEFETEDVSAAGSVVTTAGASISTVNHLRVSTAEDISTAKTLFYIRRSAAKDKGKAKMDESEPRKTKTKLQVHEEAFSFNIEEWEDIQATIEADEELAQRIQAKEREKYSKAENARLLAELINQRKIYFSQQRAEERRNKPLTQAQQRTTMRRVGAFVPMETEIKREVSELATGSSKRDAEEELDQGSSKRQKTGENSEPVEESKEKEDDELSQEELQVGNHKEVELKRLFEPDVDDELWKSQKHVHDITWRLYDTCGVQHVSIKDGIDIYMLVEKEYPLSRGVLTQMLAAKLLVEQNNEMSRELLRKIFMMAERPRRKSVLKNPFKV
ncbi:hypothetical protein Tco_0010073 [Tanacetum coccineum]